MKKIIITVIRWLGFVFHHNHNSKIIYYHDVGTKFTSMGTDLDRIKRHLSIVKKSGFEIVSAITREKGQIQICFDDGWQGIYEAKDFFIDNSIIPTIFVAVDLIGEKGYLSLNQIIELQSKGFIFEGHTWSHRDLTTLSDAELFREIKSSREELGALLGKPINSICFPRGRFSRKIIELSNESGYLHLFSSVEGGYYDLIKRRGIICRNLVQFAGSREFYYIINSTSTVFKYKTVFQHFKR